MIFYFSGTGNSLWVAKELGGILSEPLLNVAEAMAKGECSFRVREEERLVFVFPVHSWGIAVAMRRFMELMEIKGYEAQPVFAICTCGDDCGTTDRMLRRLLGRKGLPLHAVFSVQMPNNYILLPGFDVDSKAEEQQKLRAAQTTVAQIGEMLAGKRPLQPHYTPGRFARLKTSLVYPLFARFSIGKTSYYTTDACISCGLCEKVCPTRTISFDGWHPSWGTDCVQCLACIHRCPVRAIEYGKETIKKGRYKHPDL